MRRWIYVLIAVSLVGFGSIRLRSENQSYVFAQPRVSDTPVPVVIPTLGAQATGVVLPTASPSFTPTEEGPVTLIAAVNPGEINVRDEPDPTGNRLGSLEPEQQYRVRGRFFQWYQFDYDASETGTAWVFGQLVEIVGDESRIPNVDPFAPPTAAPSDPPETATAAAILQTPGGIETATSESRIIELATNEALGTSEFPPTFTPPPDVVARVVIPSSDVQTTPTPKPNLLDTTLDSVLSGELPPIVPIALLGIFGLLGLVVALIRRK